MIIDACLFAGEQAMLELRFRTLRPVVDRFCVVACGRTHQGQQIDREAIERAFVCAAEMAMVKARLYWVEPEMVLVRRGITYERAPDERGPAGTRWFQHIEKQHRDGVLTAVKTLTYNRQTIVAVSDVDEIPLPKVLRDLGELWGRDGEMLCCAQRFHSGAFDLLHPVQPWWGTMISTLGTLENVGPQAQRDARTTIGSPDQCVTVQPLGGWHFSWFGTDVERQTKLDTFSHAELAGADLKADRELRRHVNGEPLTQITAEQSWSLDWPAPLLDGSFVPPDGWLTSDLWAPD